MAAQHDDKDEDSIHAIVIANVHETKPDKENEKSLEAGRNQTKPAEGEDEGDDEAAGESRRRKPKTNTKSTTETRRKTQDPRRRERPDKTENQMQHMHLLMQKSTRSSEIDPSKDTLGKLTIDAGQKQASLRGDQAH